MGFYKNVEIMDDEELLKFVDQAADTSQATHPDYQTTNRLNIGLTVLSLRSQMATRAALKELQVAIDAFKRSSDRFSRAYILLTIMLGFLAVIQIVISARGHTLPPPSAAIKQGPVETRPDPLGLYGLENPRLTQCLERVDPKDPLGLFTDDTRKAKERQACFEQFGKVSPPQR